MAFGWHARLRCHPAPRWPLGSPRAQVRVTVVTEPQPRRPAHSLQQDGRTRGLPAPPGSLASWRGVGGRLGSGGGLAEIQASPQTPIQPCGEGESRGARAGVPVSHTHWGDLGQTSLLPPSPGRIRTLGGGRAGPIEGRRPSPPQRGVWGRQRLLLCPCLRSHPRSCATGRVTPAPHHPPHSQGSPSQPHQQSPAPPCPS